MGVSESVTYLRYVEYLVEILPPKPEWIQYMKTDSSALTPYIDAGWQLIPLHRFDKVSTVKGRKLQRGKTPLHKDWTTQKYNSRKLPKYMNSGKNVGVRLRETDLVVDVDPRNYNEKDDPLARLCKVTGIRLEDYPVVITGGGGQHIYMTIPEGFYVRDTMPEFKGIEYKSVGRQVVSAGSIHPDTKKLYEWEDFTVDLTDVRPAPQKLMDLIERPPAKEATGGGELSSEELVPMLDTLDAGDFADQSQWFDLMSACHHATGGDGREEFIQWSISDPEYAHDEDIIAQRWDSLDSNATNAITIKSLYRAVREHGDESVLPVPDVADDFADDDIDLPDEAVVNVSGKKKSEPKGPLEKMNEKYTALMEGGKFRVFYTQSDPILNRDFWIAAPKIDFMNYMANKSIQKDDKKVPLAQAWMEWGGRNSKQGVLFDPKIGASHPDFLNLWQGWAYDPVQKEGGWSLLETLLRDGLCAGDADVFEYVMKWSAYMIQRPEKPAEVAICFQGPKGAGKGTFGRTMSALAGRHGMHVTSSSQVSGRFNSHLRDTICLFADEAITPHDKEAESKLKGLITEKTQAYEGKGADIITGRNCVHIIMASNDDWFIPMGMEGERRFMVQKIIDIWANQKEKFRGLNAQLDNGGYEALMYDLLNMDIGDWAPRKDIPATEAAAEQKELHAGPIPIWWKNMLADGHLGTIEPLDADEVDWADEGLRVFRQDFISSFEDYCRAAGIRAGSGGRSNKNTFFKQFSVYLPKNANVSMVNRIPEDRLGEVIGPKSGRVGSVQIPSLKECRDHWDEMRGRPTDWGSLR